MIRFILVCIVVIGYLILSIPILLVEWIIGKFSPVTKDISSLRIIQAVFRFILRITGAKITVIGEENVPGTSLYCISETTEATSIYFSHTHAVRSAQATLPRKKWKKSHFCLHGCAISTVFSLTGQISNRDLRPYLQQ